MNANNWILLSDVVASTLTALAVLYLGHVMSIRAKRLEASMSVTEILIKKRIAIYDSAAPLLNDVLCYMTYVGQWRELKPTQIIQKKRELDTLLHSSRPFFNEEVFERYRKFVDLAFSTDGGRGTSAKIKANIERHAEEYTGEFETAWKRFFVEPENRSRRADVTRAYQSLLKAVGAALRKSDGG